MAKFPTDTSVKKCLKNVQGTQAKQTRQPTNYPKQRPSNDPIDGSILHLRLNDSAKPKSGQSSSML